MKRCEKWRKRNRFQQKISCFLEGFALCYGLVKNFTIINAEIPPREETDMCERTVRFRHVEDIRDFVRAACRCSFDIDVISDRLVIDAKSILGVLSLECNKELSVRYEERDPQFEHVLGKYAVL